MSDFETQLKLTFLEEAQELLEGCEQSFMDLESESCNKSVLTKIFRLAHSFKGSAGAAGFEDLMHLAHHLESLLVKLTEGKLTVSPHIVSLLLRSNDQLRRMVSELRNDVTCRIPIQCWIDEIQMAEEYQELINSTPTESEKEAAAGANKPAALSHPGFEIFSDDSPTFSPKLAIAPTPAEKIPVHAAEESIRVNLRRIDSLVNDVGELVILQTTLYQYRTSIESPFIQKTIAHLEKITRQIQDTAMGLRLVSIKPTFQKMQRIVRDSAQALDKKIILETHGEETEIDKTVLDILADPLVHLIRNAVDHGIETCEDRIAAGKKPEGLVVLNAFNQGDKLIIEIRDDGKGLDTVKLLAKARAIGLVSATANPSLHEIYQLIFASGFSTKDAVTSLSGRGVGMDVVKTHIEQVKGTIDIQSEVGKGTTFRIILPLSMALIDGMIIRAGGQRYVIPITAVVESLQPREENLDYVTGRGYYLNLRGKTLPVYRLTEMFKSAEGPELTQSIAIVGQTSHGESFALIVEDIIGQQQIVVKALGPELQNVAGLTGAAILGDGRAALILDIAELVQGAARSHTSATRRLAS